jgi:hypothetical protein
VVLGLPDKEQEQMCKWASQSSAASGQRVVLRGLTEQLLDVWSLDKQPVHQEPARNAVLGSTKRRSPGLNEQLETNTFLFFFFFFFFFAILGFELGAYTLSHSASLIFVMAFFFRNRVSQTICLGWL